MNAGVPRTIGVAAANGGERRGRWLGGRPGSGGWRWGATGTVSNQGENQMTLLLARRRGGERVQARSEQPNRKTGCAPRTLRPCQSVSLRRCPPPRAQLQMAACAACCCCAACACCRWA